MTEEERIKIDDQLKALGIDFGESTINKKWNCQKFIHVAVSKWGKTIYWAQDHCPYFIKLENRHGHIVHRGVDCRTYEQVDAVIGKLLLAAQKGVFPFTSVVVDPVDRLIQRIDEDVMEWGERTFKTQYNCIGDIPNGAGWARRTALTNSFLARFEDLPCAKVLLFHSHVEEKDDRKKSKVKKQTIDVGGKAGGKFLGWSDHILHGELVAVGDQVVRRLHTKGTQTMEAGKSNPDLPDMMVQKSDPSKGPVFPVIRENFMAMKNCFEWDGKVVKV